MANAVYPSALKGFMDADIDLLVDDIRAILVDTGAYTYSSAHDFLDDVPGGARIAVSGAMTGKSTTGGVFDADDVTWTSVSGVQSEAIVLYKHDGGADSARRLIAYIDTGVTGLPVTPNGGNIITAWDNGANKIFTI